MCLDISSWVEVESDAHEWVADAIASGDLDVSDSDAVDQWVHETADGCGHVIWTRNNWGIWSDVSCPVDEDDLELAGGIGAQLTAYAYAAVVHALESAVSDTTEGLTA